MIVRFVRAPVALALSFSLALSGCADAGRRSADSAGVAPDSVPAKGAATAATIGPEFAALIGLSDNRAGKVCVAMPTVLKSGRQITIVSVPVDGGMPEPYSASAAQIVSGSARQCATDSTGRGISIRGDSLYIVSVSGDAQQSGPPGFAVDLPLDKMVTRNDSVFGELANSDRLISFRICTSGEGLHYTAWLGTPVSGQRIWHRYHYVGYDMVPTCLPPDYEGTGGW